MNEWLTTRLRMGRRAPARPRQGHDLRGPRGRPRLRPLQGGRRRRHPLPHLSRHAPTRAAISPAAPRAIPTPATARRARSMSDNMERLLRKFDTARHLIPALVRRDAKRATTDGVIFFGSSRRRSMRRSTPSSIAACTWTPCGSRASPSPTRSSPSSPSTSGSSSSNRTATRQLAPC